MTNPLQQVFPAPNTPVVGPGGVLTQPWRYFLNALFQRTGGSTGTGGVQSFRYAPGEAPEVMSATGSPYTFTAPSAGEMAIGGNGVHSVTINRAGTPIPVARHYGIVPLRADDELVVIYDGSPLFTWLPD